MTLSSTQLRALAATALLGGAACGGSVAPGASPQDAAAEDAGKDGPVESGSHGAELVACATSCIASAGGAGGGCPVLLTYECLRGPCGDSASTAICAAGDGTPPSVTTILCAQAAFPSCPANTCQNDATCRAFVACIEACR